jgi:hypothetical protein
MARACGESGSNTRRTELETANRRGSPLLIAFERCWSERRACFRRLLRIGRDIGQGAPGLHRERRMHRPAHGFLP